MCLKVRASVAVTSISCRTVLSDVVQNIVVLGSKLPEQQSHKVSIPHASPTNAAYVVFTSGSTGQPKGCIVEHHAFCSAAVGHGPMLNINQDTRSLQFSSYAFGVCLLEILTTLIHGGCVCIPGEEERSSVELPAAIRKMNANWTLLTPSGLASLCPEDVPNLRTVVLGGEPVQIKQVHEWSAKTHLKYGYGCAEACVATTILRLGEGSTTKDVGHAVTGRCWLVGEEDINQLAPVGTPGELIVEGTAMAREYISDPEHTARAFIAMPSWRSQFGPCEAASRFYKTGDLAIFNSDGSIRLLGRKDTQVKINGQRIEVEEIEHQIKLSTSLVREVAVEFTTLNTGDKTGSNLIGFLVLEQDNPNCLDPSLQDGGQIEYSKRAISTIQNIQANLQKVLPHYMVPFVFTLLASLPKTRTGKIFRRELRDIGSAIPSDKLAKLRSYARGEVRQPQTEQESRLRKLWAQILNVDINSVGCDDNFFRLGGDSKVAIQLVGMARNSGLAITVADVFRKPTLSALAQAQSINTHSDSQEIDAFSLLKNGGPVDNIRQELADLCSGQQLLIEDAYPCTPLQEGMLSLSEKGIDDYVVQIVLQMSAEVELVCFREAWENVIRSTAILRTRFVQHHMHGLLQVVCRDDIKWIQHSNLESYRREDSSIPMVLGGHMSRYALVKDDNSKVQHFVWTVHHAIHDGWSLPRIIELVAESYKTKSVGNRPNFNVFIKHIVNTTYGDDEAYWRSCLAEGHFSPFPSLSSPMRETATADSLLQFEHKFTNKEAMGVTASTLIRGALAILISRHTAAKDVIFGAVLSGRNASVAGIEDIIGTTIATVPVRTRFETDASVLWYLQSVQEEAMEMIPFEQSGLKRIAKIDTNGRNACGFQTLLAVQLENGIKTGGDLGKWTLSSTRPAVTTYPFGLECWVDKETLNIQVVFDETVMGAWQVQHILHQLDLILTQLENPSPGQMISQINALTVEDEKVIWAWNEKMPDAVNHVLHELISEQVVATPDSPAVSGVGCDLTFRELGELSDRLARYLIHLGVCHDDLVVICFEKSVWAVVAMLSVLKAGAAFVPIDPSLPIESRLLILEKTQSSMVLTSESHNGIRLPSNCKSFGVSRNSLASLPKYEGVSVVTSGIEPSSIAYIIFTSGSTGQPKGVVIEHRAITSNCLSHGAVLGLSSTSRVLQFASYTFDACIFEIFMTLIHGGCVCVPSEDQRLGDLAGAMNYMAVNVAFLTPTVAQTVQPGSVPSMHTLVMGGEAVKATDYDRWDGFVSKRFNGYGPTETTVLAVVDRYDRQAIGNNRIGKAIGCTTWLVDPWDHNRLAPLGAIGELLIEGPSLAREYLADPETTAAAFIKNPPWLLRGCCGSSGREARLYKTGDLVRYNQDGSLSFIGRQDNRLKIRGQWLDIANVEYQVRKCLPSGTTVIAEMIDLVGSEDKKVLGVFIRTFAFGKDSSAEVEIATNGNVKAKLDGNTANRMFCKCLPVADGLEVVRLQPELESALLQSVSAKTVAIVYFRVSHFPIMTSGKTDRRRLRELGSMLSPQQLVELQKASDTSNGQTLTEIERLLQQIWAQVLNIEADSIGIDDNFLHMGGDSISAMQVSAAARASLIDVSTTDILGKKTIAAIAVTANYVRDDPTVDFHTGTQESGERALAFSLSPIQQLYVQYETSHIRYFDQHFFVKLPGLTPYAFFKEAMETIVSRHPMLRARFSQDSTGKWQQRVVADVSSSLHIHQGGIEGKLLTKEEKAMAIRQCREAVDIENGPLVAAVLFNDANATSLFISIHYLVIDLVSWRILLQELEWLLGSQRPQLPKTMDFQKWCMLQAHHAAKNLKDSALVTEPCIQQSPLVYWGLAELEITRGNTLTQGFKLDATTSAALLGPCNNAFATRPVELMIGALFHSFITTFTDRCQPTIFSEGHGREPWDDSIDVSRTIGWFTTLWPVQLPSAANELSLLHNIRLVKDAIRGLSKNGWAYFTSRFANEEDAKANDLKFPVEIMFNYAGSFQQFERSGSLIEILPTPDGCHPQEFLEQKRFALFDVVAKTDNGSLSIDFEYDARSLHQQTILSWVQQYQSVLQKLVSMLSDKTPEWTLADFPMAFKSYDAIVGFRDALMPQLDALDMTAEIEDIYPCTPNQQRTLADQEKDAYRSRIFFDIVITASDHDGEINLSRIERSWRAIVQRHPVLRTLLVNGTPGSSRCMNVVLRNPEPSISLEMHKEDVEFVQGTLGDEYEPIHYTHNGLQHHLTIRQRDEKHATLRFEMNHAIIDGYSAFTIFMNDFRQAYDGRLDTVNPGPPFSRFIQYVEQQPREEGLAYWMQYLSSAEPSFIFTPSETKRRRSDVIISVPGIDTEMVNAFCSRWEVTKVTIVQAAWALVLKMYTGCLSPCFGLYTSGRDIPIKDVDHIFGPLICYTPSYIQLDERRSVLEMLKKIHEDYFSSLPYQTYPMADVWKALNIGPAGLFNTILSYQRGKVDNAAEALPVHSCCFGKIRTYSSADITIQARDIGSELTISLLLKPYLISETEAMRLASAFGLAIRCIISNPETLTSGLDLKRMELKS